MGLCISFLFLVFVSFFVWLRSCLFIYFSHDLGSILCESSSKLQYAGYNPCNSMQQLSLVNRGWKHYFSQGCAWSAQRSTYPKHMGRKSETDLILAMGQPYLCSRDSQHSRLQQCPSTVPALPSWSSITKLLHQPGGPGYLPGYSHHHPKGPHFPPLDRPSRYNIFIQFRGWTGNSPLERCPWNCLISLYGPRLPTQLPLLLI